MAKREEANSIPPHCDYSLFYRSSQKYLEGLKAAERSKGYYGSYIKLLKSILKNRCTVLDLGCGTGYSSSLLSQENFRVTGVDISLLFLQSGAASKIKNLNLIAGDAFSLPFVDGSFDVVASFQFIEHIPDVPRVLDEMMRVMKQNGLLIIVGPNLFSPVNSLRTMIRRYSRKKSASIFGKIEQYKSPFGNSFLEMVWILVRNLFLLSNKWLSSEVTFYYREPDLKSGAGGDVDSRYLSNSRDLKLFLQKRGWKVLTSVGGKSRFLGPFSSNIQIIAKRLL